VLSGLYEPGTVTFTVDGRPHPELADLGSVTTLIPQDPEIFENTVAYNVTMGVDVAEADLLRACALARLTPIVEVMPHGLETPIVERGGNLSGGQKQRLALARGMLAARSSSIIMLDEPTSSLDPATEAEVYGNLSGGQKQRLALARGMLAARSSSIIMLDEPTSSLDPATEAEVYGNLLAEFPDACIVSSIHRLHLLPQFTTIVYMADGRIVDLGGLSDLIHRQPAFRRLWEKATASLHTRAA